MEDRCRQHGIRPTFQHSLREVLECADTTACNHRHVDSIHDGAGEGDVESFASAVTIHRSQQDLSCAERYRSLRPFAGVDAGCRSATVHEHLVVVTYTFGVDRTHHALITEVMRNVADQLGALHGGGVHAHLVGPGTQQRTCGIDITDSSTNSEWNEELLGRTRYHIDHGHALIAGCRDVEEHHFVGSLGVVPGCKLHRIAGITQANEVDAFHHPTIGHVQTRNHACDTSHERQSRNVEVMLATLAVPRAR